MGHDYTGEHLHNHGGVNQNQIAITGANDFPENLNSIHGSRTGLYSSLHVLR